GVARAENTAMSWFRKAADMGSARNMNNVGMMYEEGRGVTPDRVQAVSWYRKAARLGDATAQENLRALGETW
ncbi:sel1 repeat family protein, partial [Candidatus Sumerlaeota bacterium]|nr:sel1 repeat family protein [Candidatus Sumerlaeota bacterium]